MKFSRLIIRILPLAVVTALASPASAQTPAASPAQQAEAFYRQGKAAENTGDPTAARQAYQKALRVNPHHANARYCLGQLKITSPAIAARGREVEFGAVMVPEFKLDQATLMDSLDVLRLIVEKQSNGKVIANFILQDPKNELGPATITLALKNMPARGILRYLLEQAGAKARYDEHAIVILPN